MHKNTFWRLIFLLSVLLTLPINIFAQNSKPQNSQLIVKYKNTPQKIKPSLSKKLLNIPITPLDYISKEKNLNLSNLKGLENMVVYDIKNNKQDQIITELKKNPNVDFVEENGIREIMATPYDPYYYNGNYYQWAYKNGFLPMESVWDNQNASSSAVLAILDTGVNINHEDLQDRIWINSTEVPNNGIDDDQNGYIDDINGWNTYADNNNVMDDFVHGTGVAAVAMATTNNNKGIAGMAWHGKIMVLKINISNSGYISISSELEALNYAAGFSQVRVINMSFGSNGGFSSEAQAIRSLVENNHITLIAAAGNDPNKKLTYPARYPGVIAVGLYNRNGIASSLTSRGAGMDVVAPGDDIYTASNNGGYMSLDGTSFAAPYVSGFAMLLAQNNENLSAGEIATNIRTWTSTLDSVNWSQFSGFGGISPLKESLKCNDVQNTITDATLTNLLENNSPIYSDTINSSQTIDIYGKVYSTAFENYQISWADSTSPSAWTTEVITLTSNQSESSERKLASFNLNVLPRDGEYVVKLEVFGDTNCNNGVLGRDNLSLPIHKVRGFAGRLIDEEGNGIAGNYIPVYDTLDDAP